MLSPTGRGSGLLSPSGAAAAAAAAAACPLALRHIFGVKGDAHSNLHYFDDQHIIYPAGYNLVLHNIEKRTQRFLPLSLPPNPSPTEPTPPSSITALTISTPKHSHAKAKLLAIAEYFPPHPHSPSPPLPPPPSFPSPSPSSSSSSSPSPPPPPSALPPLLSSSSPPSPRILLTLYDLSTLRRKNKAPLTLSLDTGPVTSLAFSPDGKTLLSLTSPPQPTLTLWAWEKGKAVTSTPLPSPSPPTFLTQAPSFPPLYQPYTASFCPTDPSVLCLSGPSTLRFLHLEPPELRSIPFPPPPSSSPLDYTAHCWMDDRLLVGTREGDLHLFENAEYRGVLAGSPSMGGGGGGGGVGGVTALVGVSKGFVCGCGDGVVLMYERDEKDIYRQSKVYQIRRAGTGDEDGGEGEEGEEGEGEEGAEPSLLRSPAALITHIAVSPTEDSLILSLSSNESFHLSLSSATDALSLSALSSQKTRRERDRYEQSALAPSPSSSPLFDSLSLSHSSTVTSLSLCVRKPLLLSTSSDRSVKVWNYLTRTVEFSVVFPSTALCGTFHPSGYYVVLSFPTHIRLCSLYLDDFHVYKTWGHRGVRVLRFSRGGQYFALASHSTLFVYDTFRCVQLCLMNKHKAEVTDVVFSADDSEVVSISKDGYVYRTTVHPATLASSAASSASSSSFAASDGSLLIGKYRALFSHLAVCADSMYVATAEQQVKHLQLMGGGDSSGGGMMGHASGSLSMGYHHKQSLMSHHSLHVQVSDIPMGEDVTAMTLLHHLNPSASPAPTHLSSSSTARERMLVVGTESGCIRLYALPYDANNPRVHELQLFSGKVTALILSLDQSLLFASSDDACIAIIDVERRSLQSLDDKKASASSGAMPFSEESLVSAGTLGEQQRVLAHLQSTMLHLSQQHASLLQELEHGYLKKLKEMSERYEREMESDKRRYRSEEEEKERVERAFQQREAEMRQLMNQRKAELIEQHRLKMTIERERYEELQRRMQAAMAAFEEDKGRLLQTHSVEREALEARLEGEVEALEMEEERVRKEKEDLIAEFEEYRELMEEDLDVEMGDWKAFYHTRLHAEKAATVAMKEQHALIKAEFQQVKQELAHNHSALQRHLQQHHSLQLSLSSASLSLSSLEKENAERAHSLVDKAARQFELKKKNQELEKFRFVLDYKIAELKRMIAPKRNERGRLMEEVGVMKEEVGEYGAEREGMLLQVKEMRMKAEGLQREQRQRAQEERDMQRQLHSFTQDVQAVRHKIDDLHRFRQSQAGGAGVNGAGKDAWKDEQEKKKDIITDVRRLYHKHLTDAHTPRTGSLPPITPAVVGGGYGQGGQAAAYQAQVVALEGRVASCLAKMKADEGLVAKEERRRREENVQLTLQVNEMRREGVAWAAVGKEEVGREEEERKEREHNVRERRARMMKEEAEYQQELIDLLTQQLSELQAQRRQESRAGEEKEQEARVEPVVVEEEAKVQVEDGKREVLTDTSSAKEEDNKTTGGEDSRALTDEKEEETAARHDPATIVVQADAA